MYALEEANPICAGCLCFPGGSRSAARDEAGVRLPVIPEPLNLSKEGRQLIKALTESNPEQRATVQSARLSPWLAPPINSSSRDASPAHQPSTPQRAPSRGSGERV